MSIAAMQPSAAATTTCDHVTHHARGGWNASEAGVGVGGRIAREARW